MLIRPTADIKSYEITDESVWKNRRQFLQSSAAVVAGGITGGVTSAQAGTAPELPPITVNEAYQVDEDQTPYEAVTSYNNFYEFGLDKEAPAKHAHLLNPRPWTLAVSGECEKPREWDIDEILKQFPQEERVYRFRCVEAWSMVIPWVGFSLGDLIKASNPTSKAKFVVMETLVDPEQMPGQKKGLFGSVLDWPYVEGLRIDEATHPLSLMVTGLYGKTLPNQNGAPLRLMVPWKYGFKSIKSIVSLKLVEEQPINTWQIQAAREYGFYANVNPQVDHPRWSQARERRVGEWGKRDTLLFNGYADQVASLYQGMDLSKNF